MTSGIFQYTCRPGNHVWLDMSHGTNLNDVPPGLRCACGRYAWEARARCPGGVSLVKDWSLAAP